METWAYVLLRIYGQVREDAMDNHYGAKQETDEQLRLVHQATRDALKAVAFQIETLLEESLLRREE